MTKLTQAQKAAVSGGIAASLIWTIGTLAVMAISTLVNGGLNIWQSIEYSNALARAEQDQANGVTTKSLTAIPKPNFLSDVGSVKLSPYAMRSSIFIDF